MDKQPSDSPIAPNHKLKLQVRDRVRTGIRHLQSYSIIERNKYKDGNKKMGNTKRNKRGK